MKTKFFISISLGLAWLAVSLFFAVGWAREISHILPPLYVWWVIIGIALLPGFLMSVMYIYRKSLKIPFENSLAGFIAFILFFQIIQSTAAVHGYITGILGRKAEWK